MMRQDGRNFVNKVDYLTSPGHLTGPGAREKAGLVGGGPQAAITTMGVYRFDNETREMYLEKIHPGVDLAKLKASVQWDLQISPNLTETELPTEEQVMIMRTLDPLAVYLGTGRQKLTGEFEVFMKMFENSYQPMVNLMRSKGMI
jgi:glutaconate CoA-transferase subunit B